jgi:hypothetical protein
MASSKFVEILDTRDLPYSRENVSLEDVLAETRLRSQSNGSIDSNSSSKSTSPTTPTFHQPTNPFKSSLRRLSIMKKP